MTDDIVRRLRDVDHPVSADFRIEAAAEIERLREQLRLANIDNFNTTAEVDRLTAERDEARREVCAMSFDDRWTTAQERGWDCFKEPEDYGP